MAALSPGARLGAYEIVAAAGAGGMGEVYRARDTRLNRDVALKVLPSALADDPSFRARFEREAQAVAALNHPNIVTIHSVEEAAGVPFLTMEFVDGTPLSALIPPSGLPLDRLLTLAVPLVDAVNAAHQRGIIHRDLKPANVMVTSDQRVKVLDFGLAKLRGPTLDLDATARTTAATEAGRIVGTVAYMSPEQAEGREVDARTDIFSLGVLLYEMASGRKPFDGGSSMATISAILRDTPPSLTDMRPELPPDFARIVRRSLAKEPARRYQTALDLRNELEELKAETISMSGSTQMATPRARRPVAPWIAAAIVVIAAVGGVAAWLSLRSDATSPAGVVPPTERQLTTNPLLNPIMVAAISPDGRYAAYADTTAIHIRLIETGETRTLPVPAGFCFLCATLSWSADGTRILSAGPAGPAQRDGLWSISTLTGEVRQVLEDVSAVRTSPVGSRIALLRGEADIWTAKDDGTDAKMLFSGGKEFLIGGLTWSPDGEWLAYLRRNRGAPAQSIEVRNIATGAVHAVVPAASLEEPVWTTRGLLYMTHINVDTHDLWELKLDSETAQPQGSPERVTRWNGFIPGSLSPTVDGRRMVMSRQVRQADVYAVAVTAAGLSDEQQITVDTRNDVPSAWHVTGDLFFVTNRDGSDDVWKQPASGMSAAVVPGADHARSPQVSPDGKWLLYLSWPVPPPGTPQPPITLMRMSADGGAREPVLQSTGATAGINYFGWANTYPTLRCPSAPTTRCIIAEEEKDTLVFSAFDPVEGRRTRVGQVMAPPREIAWDVSPDGTQIAYMRWAWDNGHKISVLRLRDGSVTELPIQGWTSLSAIAWAPDGANLYVISARRNGSTLVRVGINGNVTTLRSDTGRWLLNPRPSLDGRRLAFAATTADSKIWLVERN